MYHLLSQYLVWVTIIFQLLEICFKVLTIQLYNFFVFDILKHKLSTALSISVITCEEGNMSISFGPEIKTVFL